MIPAGVTQLQATATGGPGASEELADQYAGATAVAPLRVVPGETLYVEVGGPGQTSGTGHGTGGWNGGGSGGANDAAGGGGASDVRTISCASSCYEGGELASLESRLIVAGGGGGGGASNEWLAGPGGTAESTGGEGESDRSGDRGGGGGEPGTFSAFGGGGSAGTGHFPGQSGAHGAFGKGGAGAGAWQSGGGGGGGWYGGGGGGGGAMSSTLQEQSGGGGGGGGSSYAPRGSIEVSSQVPEVTIRYAAPLAHISTPTLSFGTQAQDTVGMPQTVTVTNEGTNLLVLSGATFTGSDPGDFLVGSNACLGQLAAGESCELTVVFTPHASGERTASLQIAGNDPSGPATVAVRGTGGPLPEGARGPEGLTGQTGSTGSQGPQGATGTQGADGLAGARGPQGTAGAPAAAKPVGPLELMTCVAVRRKARAGTAHGPRRRCSIVSTPRELTFAGNGVLFRAKILDGGHTIATGTALQSADGRASLLLIARRNLERGRYVLVLRNRSRGRWVTTRLLIVI